MSKTRAPNAGGRPSTKGQAVDTMVPLPGDSRHTLKERVAMGRTAGDPVVEAMRELGMELTRENYLALAYPDGTPEEGIPPEFEVMLDVLEDLPTEPPPSGRRMKAKQKRTNPGLKRGSSGPRELADEIRKLTRFNPVGHLGGARMAAMGSGRWVEVDAVIAILEGAGPAKK